MFADSSPDRWGRILMNKRERILAEKEGRKPRKLHDSDYLLGVMERGQLWIAKFPSTKFFYWKTKRFSSQKTQES